MVESGEKRPRVVIGEDESETGEALIRALSADHDVLWVQSGEEVLELARKIPFPDVLIVSASLSGIDGFSLCRSLQSDELTRSIPVLLLRDDDDDGERTYQAGAADHLRRPLDVATLRARVRIQLELCQLRECRDSALALDPITEVPDQNRVEEFIDLEWRRAVREATSLSLVLIRVDSFQGLLASSGRHAAEECLRQIATDFAASIRRPMDFLGRYHDDGFAVVLPVTEYYGATHLAELMRQQVETLTIPNPVSQVSRFVTVSVGVASLVPFPASGPETLWRAAQRGLERAILGGCNCVISVEASDEE